MLTLLLGTDWVANRKKVLEMISADVAAELGGRFLLVPELISHDTERRLCDAAGDTASRFVEVLSFSRLYSRVSDVTGCAIAECLDNGGRVAAMASAARQLHSKLKAYATVETRPEFLTGLIEAIDEFKRCCITSEDIYFASKKTEGILAQKLEELALIYDTYDSICMHGKRDPSDQMTWLLEELENSDFARNHVFYVDGFPDFTRQHMMILEHLISNCTNIVISLNCDKIGSTNPAFEKAGSTAFDIYQFARNHKIELMINTVMPRKGTLEVVRQRLFHGDVRLEPDISKVLHLHRVSTVHDECVAAADCITTLIQSGVRYRDISVVCSDMVAYQNALNMTFQRFRIPVYQSGTDDILEKPVITTVLSAIDAAIGGFDRRDVNRYIKSMLSPLDESVADLVENYTILWNIRGSQWSREWTNHPRGLGEEWLNKDHTMLAKLNVARETVIKPLARLQRGLQDAICVQNQVEVLYSFLNEIKLCEQLRRIAAQMDSVGDYRNAQMLNQLWDILLLSLEQLYDILGQSSWDTETFTRLLHLVLSQYDVGTIPPSLDAVTVGSVSAMRCQETKYLLVLGALEGSLPGYSGSVGVLTDQERNELRHLGVPLTGGGLEGVQAEFASIYGVFCGAHNEIHVFCPSGQPSFLYRRLLLLSGAEEDIDVTLGAARTDRLEAGALLARMDAKDVAQSIDLADEYAKVVEATNYSVGAVSKENIKKIYGEKLNLSASQVDRQADCRLHYFLKYGISAKERKTVTVDPAEFGTYVHAVLEQTGKEIVDLGGFKSVSLERALEIAGKYSEQYMREYFSQIDSERLQYLFKRNEQELAMVVEELWNELQNSSFVPVEFELAFGDQQKMNAIPINGRTMQAQLRGFVDRVDVWKENGQNYFRVVDYKTGKKDFDYCDVFNGYGLQMLLYLFALENAGDVVLGRDPVPAGVLYFPARVPMISADGALTSEEASAERERSWKRKGLLLSDESVLTAMEHDEAGRRLCYVRKKDGSLSGDIAVRRQFNLLKSYVFTLLGRIVDEIASGCVDPNPYTRGTNHNACAFCPYGAVCIKSDIPGRRNFKTMSAQRFWEEVEKEMSKNG